MSALKKILFVEPSEMQQKIYAAVLKPQENNWALSFAASMAAALELAADETFEIVVVPRQLPDGEGEELLAQLCRRCPETIRFLLVDEQEKRSLRGLVSSAQQVLLKPIELKPFIAQIKRALALRTLVQDPAILKLLGGSDTLPPLPRVFQELTRMLNDPNTSLHEIGELISQDIVLSSKILKLANSALFSLRQSVQSVEQAVSLLGGSVISSLVFSAGVQDQFQGTPECEAFFEELTQHSMRTTAAVSHILSSWNAGRELMEKAVFCGIAHDLGKLVLAHYAPEPWAQIQAELAKGEKTDIELERSIAGIAHSDLTAYLLTLWGFPNDQIIPIAFHHEPSRIQEDEFGLLCALHIAENCCTPEPQKENLDWTYLETHRILPDDIEAFRMMVTDQADN